MPEECVANAGIVLSVHRHLVRVQGVDAAGTTASDFALYF